MNYIACIYRYILVVYGHSIGIEEVTYKESPKLEGSKRNLVKDSDDHGAVQGRVVYVRWGS